MLALPLIHELGGDLPLVVFTVSCRHHQILEKETIKPFLYCAYALE